MFKSITRRDFMKGMLVGGVAAGSAGILAACGSSSSSSSTSSSSSEDTSSSSSESSSSSSSEDTSSSSSEEVVVEKTWGEEKAEEYTGFVETQKDLGGAVITVACVSNCYSVWTYATDDNGNIDVANTSNARLEMIAREEEIGEDYNCSFEFVSCAAKEMPTLLITAMSSGEPYGEIAYFGMTDTYMDTMYAAGVFLDLNDDELADIVKVDSNPYIFGTDVCNFQGKQLGVPGYNKSSHVGVGSQIMFNKTLAEQYGLPDLYELVNNNEWTWNKFEEILAMVKAAADDTVTPAVSEKYNQIFPGIAASNGTPIMSNVGGVVTWNGISDPVLESFNYVVQLINEGYLISNDKGRAAMLAGTAVFDFGGYNTLKAISAGTLETEGEWTFGLLPYPIGTSNTEGYNSEVYSSNTFSVMNGVSDPAGVAAVMVAMINRCGMTADEFLDYVLENVAQDEESVEMTEICASNIVFDYCQAYYSVRQAGDETSGDSLNKKFQNIQSLAETPKAAMEAITSAIEVAIEEAYNYVPETTES